MTPQEIEQILDMLIEKLGPIGGHVWSIHVRQVYVMALADGVATILLLLAALGFLIGGIYCARRYLSIERGPEYRYGVGERWISGVIGCAIGGPTFLVFGLIFGSGLLKLLNPEYYAIQLLLGR